MATDEKAPLFQGSVLRRVDATLGAVCLELRAPGETVVVVLAASHEAGVGIVSTEERRAAWGGRLPPGLTASDRASWDRLLGARVVALFERGIALMHEEGPTQLRVQHGRILQLRDEPGFPGPARHAHDRPELDTIGRALLDALAKQAHDVARERVRRAADRAIERIGRRVVAMERDLSRLDDADRIAAQAQWLVAEAARAPRGATSLTVTDWSTGEPLPLVVPLDPARPARAQVDAMFHRARRLKRGAAVTRRRIEEARVALSALEKCKAALASADLDAVDRIADLAKRSAPKDFVLEVSASEKPLEPAAKATQGPLPFRTFQSRRGSHRILVGRNATHNDELTLHVAKPQDLWLHAKGLAGAHVVVPLRKNESCPADVLVDAAELAVHFSDARGETSAEVQYTHKRYLRKPKGSPAGAVVLQREKVLLLRTDADRLRALLEQERS